MITATSAAEDFFLGILAFITSPEARISQAGSMRYFS